MSDSSDTARRSPTAAEARALGHPLRLRIVFACRELARTNKELADLLEVNPGTIHYHVRQLVDQEFLRAEQPRPGPRGSREQPYRTTGKSWQMNDVPGRGQALRRAVADELLRGHDERQVTLARVGLSLSEVEVDELAERLHAIAEEFLARSRTSPERLEDPAAEGSRSVTLVLSLQHSDTADI